jgi:hypothetical protein
LPDYLISTLCLFMYFYSNQFNMDGIQSYIVIWKSEKIISLQNSEVNICCTHSNFQSNLFCITQIFRYFKWNHWFFGIRHDTQHSTVAYFGRSEITQEFFLFFFKCEWQHVPYFTIFIFFSSVLFQWYNWNIVEGGVKHHNSLSLQF